MKIYRIYNYIIFCVDYNSNYVKNVSVEFYFNFFFFVFQERIYALVSISLEARANFNKTKILNKILYILQGQLLMVQDLILALNADNVEACFILSGISFHSLGPKLYIMCSGRSYDIQVINFFHNVLFLTQKCLW